MGDVATFVTFNRIRLARSLVGSSPRTFESVDWPRFLDPDLAQQRSRPMDRRALAARAMSGRSFRFRGARLVQNDKRRPSDENRRSISSRLPAIIRHAELQSPKAPFSFPNACTTTLLPRQRIRLALRWVQPARIGVRPTLRPRGVRTPLPLSAARTRPGGSREVARRPDGTTTMGCNGVGSKTICDPAVG
jgi:hypothetical protein